MQHLDLVGNVDFAYLLPSGLILEESLWAKIIVVVLLLLFLPAPDLLPPFWRKYLSIRPTNP